MTAANGSVGKWRRAAALAAALTAAACGAFGQSENPLTYVDILQQLTDLDRLTRVQTGCKGGLFSSWDRNSKTRWGANGDAGQYLRVEPNGEAVMIDIDGPGVIYRIWSANPIGKIRIYLDGAQAPAFESNFNARGTAYAAESGPAQPIETRFSFWFNGNGIIEKYWIPREDGRDYELTPCLQPLGRVKTD